MFYHQIVVRMFSFIHRLDKVIFILFQEYLNSPLLGLFSEPFLRQTTTEPKFLPALERCLLYKGCASETLT